MEGQSYKVLLSDML